MTVSELMVKLSFYDPTMNVVIRGDRYTFLDVDNVDDIDIILNYYDENIANLGLGKHYTPSRVNKKMPLTTVVILQ